MANSLSINDVKITWAGYEIIGDRKTALFATVPDTSVDAPDPTHFIYVKELTSWGSRNTKQINDADRTLSIQVAPEGAQASIDIINQLYENQTEAPLKIVSIDPDTIGQVLHEYDSAILRTAPNIATLSNSFAVLNIEFSVGSQFI